MRSAAAVTALAVALALAAPAQAAVREGGPSAPQLVRAAWQWIAGFWLAPADAARPAAPGRTWEKEGTGIDPLGKPGSPPPPTTNLSGAIDPMG
jgi:hypothetical protein